MEPTNDQLRSRISDYLTGGGLFNPELADHTAVRDLLIDLRNHLITLRKAPQPPRKNDDTTS